MRLFLDYLSLDKYVEIQCLLNEFRYLKKSPKRFEFFKIKVFAQYRLWKPFRKWRKTIKYRKFNASKAVLRDNLILANPALGQAVTQLKNDCKSVTELIVFRMDDRRTWQLNEFNEVQTEVSNGVRDHILAFHKRTVTLLGKFNKKT